MYDNSETEKAEYQLNKLDYEDMRFIAEKCYESIYRKMRDWRKDPECVNIIMRTARFRVVQQIFPQLRKESGMRYSLESIFENMHTELNYEYSDYLKTLEDSPRKETLIQRRIDHMKILEELDPELKLE